MHTIQVMSIKRDINEDILKGYKFNWNIMLNGNIDKGCLFDKRRCGS